VPPRHCRPEAAIAAARAAARVPRDGDPQSVEHHLPAGGGAGKTPINTEEPGSAEAVFGLRKSPKDGWRIDVCLPSGPVSSLSVDLGVFVSQSQERIGQIDKAEALISTDPEILGGVPVIAGTRVPVDIIAAALDKGSTVEDVLATYPYPGLTKDRIEAAWVYARVHPRRGRPAKISDSVPGSKIVSTRRIERNQRRSDA
jgi:uncharacterized protein (DUF433 family)